MFELFVKELKVQSIAVSGFTRSGKAMMMKLLSTYDRIDKPSEDIFLEHIYFLHKINKISDQTAKYLLKKNFNILYYFNLIGRNINFKKDDWSSALNYHNPKMYTERLNSTDLNKRLTNKNKIIYQMMLHTGLNSGKLLLSSLPSLKIIEMVKNPIEIAYSWIKKNYGKNIYNKPTIYAPTCKFKKNIVPYYASGWEEEYLKMNEYDRVIKIITNLFLDREKEIKKLSKTERKRVMIVFFDTLVTQPKIELKRISKFIKRDFTSKTLKLLTVEKIPRSLFSNDYLKKIKFLKKKSTPKIFKKLIICEKKYLKNLNYNKNDLDLFRKTK